MPLTFPLAIADFANTLRVQQVTFDSPENVQMSMTGGGEIVTAELAPSLWRGSVVLAASKHAQASATAALISTLRKPGRAFYIYDHSHMFPASDPTGSILGAATPAINSLNADTRQLSLKALPASYVLTAGDYLAFDYGSLRALHRLVEDVTADGTGTTAEFEVVPNIRPGAAVDDVVTLIRAACKAIIVPSSFSAGTKSGVNTSGLAFQWNQTLA